jgi:hypothetical protein
VVALAGGHPVRAVVWNPFVTLAMIGLPLLGLLTATRPRATRRSGVVLRRVLGSWWGRILIAGAVIAQSVHLTVMLR